MENNVEELKAKINKLEREVELYKGMINEFPFNFTYSNPLQGTKLVKTKDGFTLIDRRGDQKESTGASGIDIPFEQVEHFLTPIFDLVHHHIVFINREGIVTLCNIQTAADLGVDRDQVVGRHIRELLGLPDSKINLLETLKTEKPIVNREVLDKNYGINNTHIIRDSDGEVLRVVGTFQFLNGIKEAEKRGLAGRIAAGIAHEIRNPLTTVRGFLQVMDSEADEDTSSLIKSLLIPELDRANKIITDFLRIAKPLEASTEKLEIESFITEYICKFLNSEALLYNITFSCTISEEAKGCTFDGNKEEFLQVFINLFSNSYQAKAGPLDIEIDIIKKDANIEIHFKDNGSGIKPSMIPHVFDPFFTTKDEGTGLGLSVSKKIIENHGGSMTVASNQDGTTFTISLPILNL
ncbi:two-component system sensor histidine kinase NtrB [Bacillus sp. SCS-153A]|uniref:two-component system sensor histidine kinase NtrB n=1 Tax=Rossellomorea sedimentorum TaxID=3115294 RepID=UPI003905B778